MNNSIEEDINGYTRILTMSPPWDRRDTRPEKDYGIHGLDIRFELLKNNRAVHFIVYTNIYLPHIYEKWKDNNIKNNITTFFKPMGVDVGYHSPNKTWENQRPSKCHLLEGGQCYSDGSSLRGKEWGNIWLEQGNDTIWAMLEMEWLEIFEEKS